jgi:hypothetical protein
MFKRVFRTLFGQRRRAREPFTDPLLGRLSPDEQGWTVAVVRGDDSFQFTVGGSTEPDPALLAHAHDILSDYESFRRSVRDYINSESGAYPEEVRAELSRLEIDNISLCWPDRPDHGMIFFRGPDDAVRLWRCDYIDRKPRGLGCDT